MTIKLAWQQLKGLNGIAPSGGQPADIDSFGGFLVGSVEEESIYVTRNIFVMALDWTVYDTTLNSNCVIPAIIGFGVAFPWDIHQNISAVPAIIADAVIVADPEYLISIQSLGFPDAVSVIEEEGSHALMPKVIASAVAITDDILESTIIIPAKVAHGLIVFNVNFLISRVLLPMEVVYGAIGPFAINVIPKIAGSGTMVTGSVTDPFVNKVYLPKIVAIGTFLHGFSSHQSMLSITGNGAAVTGQEISSSQSLPMILAQELLYEETVGDSFDVIPFWIASGALIESVDGLHFEAVSMHTERQALVEYSNFEFNSFAKFNGVFIAASENGIFELAGDKDDGVDIDSVIRTGTTDFGSQHLKRVTQMHVSYITEGNLLLSTITDKAFANQYTLKQTPEVGLHPVRVLLGRGVMARHWQFEIRNVSGCDFSLNEMQCDPIDVQRKVGGVHA